MSTTRQFSFSGGEIVPSLWARVDLVKYATGCRTLKNFMVMRHGGATNRPGTGFVGEVKDSTKAVRQIPFVFNADQTYVLEFGDQYMRVHRDGGQVTETPQNIEGATQADPCVVTITGHGYSNGDEVYINGITGMVELNNRNFKVANVTADTFSLQYMDGSDVDSTGFSLYQADGTVAKIYEISTPYLEADLADIHYVQSADVVTLTHPSYETRELTRTGHTSWTLSTVTFGATLSAPANVVVTKGGAGSKTFNYKVTAVAQETFEESLAGSGQTTSAADPTTSNPHVITWDAVTGAQHYNVYREINGQYGWIGVAGGTSFDDTNYTPDTADTPPEDRQPFTGAGNYPSTVAYYQQRRMFANTDNNPEKVWATKSALHKNLMISSPLQDDDAVTFSLSGRQVNEVKHLLDLGRLLVFTSGGEWVIAGDPSGILTPGEVNPRQYSANGSGDLAPLVVGGSALYVQARGSVIRDLAYDFQTDGYTGNELTIFAAHFFDGYTLVDWAYQQIPHSIVWAVRNDGKLLGMTYVREHQVFGWHQHDLGGAVENVCVVPEGTEDVLYMVVKRTINGRSVRYIEQMKTRQVTDIVDAVFMDCALSFDGRNTDTNHTMTLSGGTNWTYDEELILTSSESYFEFDTYYLADGTYLADGSITASGGEGVVGDAMFLYGPDGTELRCTIVSYVGDTSVTVRPHKTVPANMRNVALSTWSRAVDTVTGLWHLEGEDVSVLVDGFVSASPNNDGYETRTVTNGTIALDDPHAVIHVGLPYTSDLQTLNIDRAEGRTLADKKKHVSKLTLFVEATRGVWAGPDENNLTELKIRDTEHYDDPVALATGTVNMNITPGWNSTGSVLIRQTDPLPVSVLAVVPSGFIAA